MKKTQKDFMSWLGIKVGNVIGIEVGGLSREYRVILENNKILLKDISGDSKYMIQFLLDKDFEILEGYDCW